MTSSTLTLIRSSILSSSQQDHRAFVLYVDHQGHPAPLDESYHATASRRLSSSIINRGYPSTINHVDSAYCPQCLTVYTELGSGGSSTIANSSSTSTGLSSSSSSNAGGYYCTKPGCKLCPICLSVLSIHLMKNDDVGAAKDKHDKDNNASLWILYGCGNCGWSSDICNVCVPMPLSSESNALSVEAEADPTSMIGRLEMARAVNELQLELAIQKSNGNELLNQYWNQLTSMWTEESYQQTQYTKSPTSSRTRGSSTNTMQKSILRNNTTTERRQRRDEQEWNIEQLDESLNEKKKKLIPKLQLLQEQQDLESGEEKKNDPMEVSKQSKKGISVHRIRINSVTMDQLLKLSAKNQKVESDSEENLFLFQYDHIPMFSYHQQGLNTPLVAASTPVESGTTIVESKNATISSLLPLLIPLRLRTSRRCRMELLEGRPGILLKPKLNPLEGDSSLRTGQGQWYKKDCSAIAIIPRVDIIEHYQYYSESSTTEQKKVVIILLRVSNPTLGTVRLRLGPSHYEGEPALFPEINGSVSKSEDLQDLVVDTIRYSLTPTIVHAKLQTETFAMIHCSETVELLSAEDCIIELGAVRARETPKQVVEWRDDHRRIVGDNIKKTSPSIRLIAHSSSDAWFEIMGTDDNIMNSNRVSGDGTNPSESDLPRETSSNTTAAATKADGIIPSPCVALPLSLQVELGNGSWESSLIPPSTNTTNDDNKDHVTFDLVLVLPETTSKSTA